jgi:hypothetical protein
VTSEDLTFDKLEGKEGICAKREKDSKIRILVKNNLNFTISDSYLKEPQFKGFEIELFKIICKAFS